MIELHPAAHDLFPGLGPQRTVAVWAGLLGLSLEWSKLAEQATLDPRIS
jgi:hypothetical protein